MIVLEPRGPKNMGPSFVWDFVRVFLLYHRMVESIRAVQNKWGSAHLL